MNNLLMADVYPINHTANKEDIVCDDFGLSSSVVQNMFYKKCATHIVARVVIAGEANREISSGGGFNPFIQSTALLYIATYYLRLTPSAFPKENLSALPK